MAVAIGLVTAPLAPANAAIVSSDEQTVTVTAAPSERNDFVLDWCSPLCGNELNVSVLQYGDPETAPLVAGPGCSQVGNDVKCRAASYEATFVVSTGDLADDVRFFPSQSFEGRLIASLGTGDDEFHSFEAPIEVRGDGGDDRIFGSAAGDELVGGPGLDVLVGYRGADQLRGGPDADRLNGGDWRDTIRGGDGDDLLWGFSGADSLFGGEGPDFLLGGKAEDVLSGRDGRDRIDAVHEGLREGGTGGTGASDESIDEVDCGANRDRLWHGDTDHFTNCERREQL